MSREVFCTKLKKQAPGLDKPVYPGELGERIFNEVSQEAWDLWLEHQTMIINEYRLSMLDPKARQMLKEQMAQFLFGNEELEKPEGFKPID